MVHFLISHRDGQCSFNLSEINKRSKVPENFSSIGLYVAPPVSGIDIKNNQIKGSGEFWSVSRTLGITWLPPGNSSWT